MTTDDAGSPPPQQQATWRKTAKPRRRPRSRDDAKTEPARTKSKNPARVAGEK
uniref:Uncharacterized protein n=1 Tax=Hyaloperonospora arabidopsidis (strain Emoy2) TaxID=559515 RepID=M4C3L6_HYAAE